MSYLCDLVSVAYPQVYKEKKRMGRKNNEKKKILPTVVLLFFIEKKGCFDIHISTRSYDQEMGILLKFSRK